jgi:hypothetical protein
MSIVLKIKEKFEQITGIPLIYQSEEMVNFLVGKKSVPVGIWYLLQDGQIVSNSASGTIRERIQARIYVGDLTELDFDAIENEKIIDKCKKILFNFIAQLKSDNDLEVEDINLSRRFYLHTDEILTGYMVDVTISELSGFNKCNYVK